MPFPYSSSWCIQSLLRSPCRASSISLLLSPPASARPRWNLPACPWLPAPPSPAGQLLGPGLPLASLSPLCCCRRLGCRGGTHRSSSLRGEWGEAAPAAGRGAQAPLNQGLHQCGLPCTCPESLVLRGTKLLCPSSLFCLSSGERGEEVAPCH